MSTAAALPSTPSSSAFGKLFHKLRTPNTPSDNTTTTNKNFSTPSLGQASKSSLSIRLQANLNASSSSLAVPDSPNSSTWEIEMPKFESDWLNAARPKTGSSPYAQGPAGAAGASATTFASSSASVASFAASDANEANEPTLQQQAPHASTLSFKSLGMGSLSRTRGKDVATSGGELSASSGGSGGSMSSTAVDSSGDRLRKASFLNRGHNTGEKEASAPKPFSRGWAQKGKDLLGRSGGPSGHPASGGAETEIVPSRASEDFRSPISTTGGYSSLSSRTSDTITPAARLSNLRRPFPSATASVGTASGRTRRAQRVPLSEVAKQEELLIAAGESGDSQPTPESTETSPPRFPARPPSSPGVHGRSRSEVPPASPKLVPYATDRSAATLTFTSSTSHSQPSYSRKPLRPRGTDESESSSSGADVSPQPDGSRPPTTTSSLSGRAGGHTSAALRQRMLHSNPSPPGPLPTAAPATTTPATNGFHRATSSIEIRRSLVAEQMIAADKPPLKSLDEQPGAGSNGDMMQRYRMARAVPSEAEADGSSPDSQETQMRGSRGLQRKPSQTLMALSSRRNSVTVQTGGTRAPLRRTESGSRDELETRPASSMALYNDLPSRREQHPAAGPAPMQDENDYDAAAVRRPASSLGLSSSNSGSIPFPRQQSHQSQNPEHGERPVLAESYRTTNAGPQRPPQGRVLAPKGSASSIGDYQVPLKPISPGFGDATPSLTQKQGYVGAQQQQQQVQVPPLGPPPEGPLPLKPKERKQTLLVVNGIRYNRVGVLGKGGSSRVYRVLDESNRLLALKRVDISRNDAETRASFINEINLLEKLRGNPQIIRLVDSEMNDEKRVLLMVLELGEVDLATLLQEKAAKRTSMNFIRHIWEQMLEAVQVIHNENVVHTDLKPANFVLVKGQVKLIDFGISKAIANDTTNIGRDQQIGTANYMPPEALMDSGLGQDGRRLMKLGRPADVWALGCILYQMVYRCTPYAHIRDVGQKIMAIQNSRFTISFPNMSYPVDERGEERKDDAVAVPADLIAAMRGCLIFDKTKRATIPELLDGSFLKNVAVEGDTVNEQDLAAIVKRVARMVGGKTVSSDDASQLANKLLLELRQARA